MNIGRRPAEKFKGHGTLSTQRKIRWQVTQRKKNGLTCALPYETCACTCEHASVDVVPPSVLVDARVEGIVDEG